ncbi:MULTISPECIES: dTDP-4-dehydrorhamnose reductase [unclassified Undibacterium]|uniref:dTDP-4-dehydrorhamnose reductase n=1 Tax=unclassified Undibacterium TaxID=2630295 RepID=UPI002AC8A857|nr:MULTISPECIES: dTDP-4-dehydrorhamnose reductase [unclassified Undibacterium]MEB0139894.1 dTDP-4-dehydrorhamnose reductase [Undibacterium sp. CCC2.1]MEB0171837.1 dTDP-4-dehydrorhamnose reductase [Undibacterium sp. CCC1.1]MEB0175653.1 dTDP-4-dehydrorhamnose reductase [Undibacterium sp. CCC3.4]MEB0216235.1 dTDP-4-dehydrorhamnose reductase [Undibacterium sp. 5I2]WPX44128.1 dTDP-4-dehydrorhamnose reductase [Undibacterium sp. CCC3.4]
MKILLTGTNGQLGRTLLGLLAPQHEVLAPLRAELDLADPAAIAAYVSAAAPDLIINPAAYTAVDQAEQDVAGAMAINATAPGVLAQQARQLGIGLIHYSTDYVFDGSLRDSAGALLPYPENAATNPLNVYGRSKLAGEEAIIASGCRHLIFRTSWVYSRYGKNFLLTMLRLAAERDALRVVNDQWGAPSSAMTIAATTASIIAMLPSGEAAQAWWDSHGGRYNLTTTGHTSWYGFTAEILAQAEAAGLLSKAAPSLTGIPASEYPVPAVRPVNSCLDTRALCARFGLTLPSWQQALAQCLTD